MSAHTPGPWKLETVPTSIGTCHKIGPFPANSARENYACVYADGLHERDIEYSKVGQELLANARLIAAAPELLAALQLMILNAETALRYQHNERNDSAAAARLANILHWPGFKDARAALAKVTP